ncbi:MAG: ankyrin repeat domain-containing protein [Phycisphaerae bacterium]
MELIKAVEAGDIASLRSLLDEGADPNFKTSYGETPLFLAINRHHDDVAMLLLDAGADANATADDGATPLFWAARHGRVNMVARLLEWSANVHASRDGVVPPLAIAVTNGHTEVVRLLLRNGADPDRSYLGQHLTHFARSPQMHRELTLSRSRPLRRSQ